MQVFGAAEKLFEGGAKTASADQEDLQGRFDEQSVLLESEFDRFKEKRPSSVERRRAWVEGCGRRP